MMRCKCGNEEMDMQCVFSVEPMTAQIICRSCGERWTAYMSGRGYNQTEACKMAIRKAEEMFVNGGGKIE